MNRSLALSAALMIVLILNIFSMSVKGGETTVIEWMDVSHLNIAGPSDRLVLLNTASGIIRDETYEKIFDYLVAGYDYGTWDGWGGIACPPAGVVGNTTLGILTGAEYLENNYGIPYHPEWLHEDVQDNWLLIDYTLYGDLNFDYQVNSEDIALFSAHYVPGDYIPVDHWYEGDLNYDGYVSDEDHELLMNNVPEPGTGLLLLTAVAAFWGLVKRRGK